MALKQVVLCRKKGLDNGEIVFAVNMSVRLVEEYQRLIAELAQRNPSFERSLADRLNALLTERKGGAT